MEWIFEPWPWYVAGPLIALMMFILIFTGKDFGMSANLRTMCSMCGAGKNIEFFNFNWKSQRWNLMVVVGAIIGGFIGANVLTEDPSVAI
ncbi:MAG TPA: YeeE/YedE family protein, partial [Salegentibacter sp.]